MAYTKQTWTAPTGTGLSRYAKSGETDTHIELALDPVNLTNTPTPFTMERMAHMEEGIAKAYDTAPPTPWAQYSGKDIPQLPDNLAGTTYKRDNDWTTTDGWVSSLSSSTLSVENNVLVVTPTGSIDYTAIARTGINAEKTVVAVLRKTIGNYKIQANNTSTLSYEDIVFVTNELGDGKVLLAGYISTGYNFVRIYGDQNTTPFYIETLYIGTGAYDRLVFDNSYHYRHLLNNAVVPTPQGLYFNGGTSYLRSKEPVTLPDVFTFKSYIRVNTKTSPQTFISIPGSFSLYINSNSTNLILSYYNENTGGTAYQNVRLSLFTNNIVFNIETTFDFTNKVVKFAKDGIQQTDISLPYIQKPTEPKYIYFGNDISGYTPFLGYMRNICFYDTALTDTQRNWLAQGNTPPILYDVTNYETEGSVSIQDADGTNTGIETDVDSNGNRILKLPSTIKANVTGNASKANVRVSLRHGNTWFDKTWTGLTDFVGSNIWTDGENIYYSAGTNQYVLNKSISTWVAKAWTGLTDFLGDSIWTDGDNIYHSSGTTHYILNKATSTWTAKTWTGLTDFSGSGIWTDGENIYYSDSTQQYVLNKTTSTWAVKVWTGLTNFNGNNIWTDGENIYYSNVATQFVLNKLTATWVAKIWTGLTGFAGTRLWTDGENIYHSNSTTQFVLNKATSTWVAKTWAGLTGFNGYYIWTDGENIYYSNSTTHFVLPATRHNYVDDAKYNSLFAIVTRCNCSTLSDRFVFRNE